MDKPAKPQELWVFYSFRANVWQKLVFLSAGDAEMVRGADRRDGYAVGPILHYKLVEGR